MKLLPILSILFLMSCGTTEDVTVNSTSTEATANESTASESNSRVVGTVHLDKTCGVLINTEIEKGTFMDLYIVNLEDKYKVEGMKLKFEFSYSRAMIPGDCSAERAASVYEVTIMR